MTIKAWPYQVWDWVLAAAANWKQKTQATIENRPRYENIMTACTLLLEFLWESVGNIAHRDHHDNTYHDADLSHGKFGL